MGLIETKRDMDMAQSHEMKKTEWIIFIDSVLYLLAMSNFTATLRGQMSLKNSGQSVTITDITTPNVRREAALLLHQCRYRFNMGRP